MPSGTRSSRTPAESQPSLGLGNWSQTRSGSSSRASSASLRKSMPASLSAHGGLGPRAAPPAEARGAHEGAALRSRSTFQAREAIPGGVSAQRNALRPERQGLVSLPSLCDCGWPAPTRRRKDATCRIAASSLFGCPTLEVSEMMQPWLPSLSESSNPSAASR